MKPKLPNWKYTNLFFVVLILTSYFLILTSSQASAQGASLKVSPSLLELKAVTPTTIRAPLTIENLSDESTDISIEFKKFKAASTHDGQIEYTDSGSDFLKNVAIIDNNIPRTNLKIGPKQKKDLILLITLDDNTPISDHYFSTIFKTRQTSDVVSETRAGLHSYTEINLGIAMNVLLSIEEKSIQDPTKEKPEIIIEEFSAPSFINKGPVSFNVKLQNKASNYISPKGTIYIKNMFGQLIGKIDLPSQNILAHSSRYLGSKSTQSAVSSQQSEAPKIIWPEKFLLGFYNARLEVENPSNKEIISQSIKFTSLPTKIIIITILGTILGLIIRKRAKAKMS